MRYSIFIFYFLLLHFANAIPAPDQISNSDFLPYQVSYQLGYLNYYKHICGGVILSQTWVLTAGRCVAQIPNGSGNSYKIIAGFGQSEQEVKVTEKILHPHYNAVNKTNDIALLKLETGLHFGKLVQPVRLPDHRHYRVLNGAMYKRPSSSLQNIPIVDHLDCKSVLGDAYSETSNVCTGIYNENYFSDCGNPLVQDDDVLIGIASWIESESLKDKPVLPATYLKISNYVDFIRAYVTNLP